MHFRQVSHDGETEAQPAVLTGHACILLSEPIEYSQKIPARRGMHTAPADVLRAN